MFRCILALFLSCVWSSVASAIIDGHNRQSIDFTQPENASKLAKWSEPKILGCTKEGFGWDGEKTTSRDGWIETEPLGIGTAWRPTHNAGIRVKLQTNYPAIVATGPNSKAFYTPSIYVRYSADRVHWSDWQPTDLKEDPRKPGEVLYTTRVGVSRRASETYHAKLAEWSKREDVDWGSDEEAFCQWLAKQDSDFFAKERPFVGYVQFLIEDSFRGSQRLTRFEADIDWAVGGRHQIPKNAAAEKRAREHGAWNFRGVESAVKKEE